MPLTYFGIEDIIERVWAGRLRAGDIAPGLLYEQFRELWKGTQEGYGLELDALDYNTPDAEMLRRLQEDVFVFSGFKTYQELKEMSGLLVDQKGKLRSLNDFLTEALQVHETYNRTWLTAEYNHAKGSARMASVWTRFDAEKETLPFLRYETIGDSHVRDEHRALDGIVRKVNDAFWRVYFPPNGWNCRCDVVQLAEAEVTDLAKRGLPQPDPMFSYNPGIEGAVFPPKHPYYKVQRKHREGLAEAIEKAKREAGI